MSLLPGFVSRNFQLKLLSTVLAVVTWGGVVYASNPPGQRAISVPVPQSATNLPAGYVLTQHIPDLQLRIAGTEQHLESFDPGRLVVRVHYEQITKPGEVDLPVDVRCQDCNVELDQVPPTVHVSVDQLSTAQVPVRIVINPGPPAGFTFASQTATPSSIAVTGPAAKLGRIEPRAAVDLSNQKANFEADVTVFLYDTNGNKVDDVNATPPTVRVVITIEAVSTKRISAVVPPIRGTVASGYQLAGITVTPATVTLSGGQDILNPLDTVGTDAVNVAGLTGDRTFTVTVRAPSGVSASPVTVTVHVSVVAVAVPTATPAASPTPTPAPPSPT
jgi:hypothetical protein